MVSPLPSTANAQKPILGQPGSVARAALTIHGKVATEDAKARRSALSLRRMNVQYRYSPIKTHHSCMRNAIPSRTITYSGEGIRGLQLCGSSTCQYCASKKHQEKSEVLANIIKNSGAIYDFWLLTLTISTDCSVFKQVRVFKSAYDRWVKSIRKAARRAGEDIAVSWAFDATFDISTGKTHLHKHAVVRTNKNSGIDWNHRLFELWKSSVRKAGGGEVSRKAFYFERVKTTNQAVKYLFKSAKEALVSQSKNSPVLSNRVGFHGLALAILSSVSDDLGMLVKTYQDFISAIKGKNWFAIPKKMTAYYEEPVEEEPVAIVDEEGEEERIKPMLVSSHFHRALCDSGYLWLLTLVLRMKKDGDVEVDTLRYLVEKYSLYEDTYWLSESNYKACIEEVSLWGEDFE